MILCTYLIVYYTQVLVDRDLTTTYILVHTMIVKRNTYSCNRDT